MDEVGCCAGDEEYPDCLLLCFGHIMCLVGCGILVPQPGTAGPLAVRAPSPNHWTVRELPGH